MCDIFIMIIIIIIIINLIIVNFCLQCNLMVFPWDRSDGKSPELRHF